MTGVDLTTIAGIDATTALIVLGESGLAMSRGPSEKHCTAWLGLWPRVRVSGGRVLSSRTRPTANRAAAALRVAAASLHQAQSACGAFFRRMKAGDADSELGAYGIANLCAGIFGAPLSVGIPARSLAVVRCGGAGLAPSRARRGA